MTHFRRIVLQSLAIAGAVAFTSSRAHADVLVLKDGTIIKGDIVSDVPAEVTILIKVGTKHEMKSFARSKIKSVADEPPKAAASGGAGKAPKPSTAGASKPPNPVGGTASGGVSATAPSSSATREPADGNAATKEPNLPAADSGSDRDSLSGRISAMREAKADAASIFRAVFDGFPANIFKWEVGETATQAKKSDSETDAEALALVSEGDAVVRVKVDLEVDAQKYANWCKGAKEALSAIAVEKKTIDWNPVKGGAVRVSKRDANRQDLDRLVPGFVSEFAPFMSVKTGRAEHLWFPRSTNYGEVAGVRVFSEQILALSKGVSKDESTEEGESLRGGEVVDKNLFYICLLTTPSGAVEVYGIPMEVVGDVSAISAIPPVSASLIDQNGVSYGSPLRDSPLRQMRTPVVWSESEQRSLARLKSILPMGHRTGAWEASPVIEFGVSGGGSDSRDLGCLVVPFSIANAGEGVVLCSRMSVPFWYSISLDELEKVSSVDVAFGERPESVPADTTEGREAAGTVASEAKGNAEPRLSWAEILEQNPDPKVVTDADFLSRITATKLPWRVKHKASGVEMLLVPPGTFAMGKSPDNGDQWNTGYDTPTHEVTISKPFYLGRTEVTQGQWIATMKANPCRSTGALVAEYKEQGLTKREAEEKAAAEEARLDSEESAHPIRKVDWEDCQKFCRKVGLALPTEAQWEYACRAGVRASTYGELEEIAWQGGDEHDPTHPVAQKRANALGFYDTIGNVAEWCQDRFSMDYYSACEDGVIDPSGPGMSSKSGKPSKSGKSGNSSKSGDGYLTKAGSGYVQRGGSWSDNAHEGCSASFRSTGNGDGANEHVGFRVMRAP